MNTYPKHKRTSKEKDAEYIKESLAYYIQQSNLLVGDKTKVQMLYDVAQGRMDESAYTYVVNPYGTENDKLKKYPARLRNYDIIGPILKMFLGENGTKPVGGTVLAPNADTKNQMKEATKEQMTSLLNQMFVNAVTDQGIPTGMPRQETTDPAQAAKEFEASYDDTRALLGQEALNFLMYDLDMDDRVQALFYDWLVTGRAFSYKDVYLNNVEYEDCDVRDVYVIGWGKTKFAEDADAVVYVRRMTPNYILDAFQDLIFEHEKSDEIMEWLDSRTTLDGISNEIADLRSENIDRNNVTSEAENLNSWDDNFIRVYHVCWKSFKKVGILSYRDMFGIEREMPVNDTYILDKSKGDISIEWSWINEVWEGYRLEDMWYLGGAPHVLQRNAINNLSECKLPYNGAIWGYRQSEIQSVVNQGLNYQFLYNVFHYRFELLLAKNKDKILAMPLGMIPNGEGWGEEGTDKFMYWMSSSGVAFYDETAPKAQMFINGMKSIDLSTGNYMQSMWEFMMQIKQEWWDLAGTNRQRYGSTKSSDLKGVNEQAIFRASMITADMYRQFDKFMERDYRGLMDASKIAWIDGKRGMYINSDDRRVWFDLAAEDALTYMETEYGIYVKNTEKEREDVERAKGYLQTMGQNGLTPDKLIDILGADSMSRIKQLAKDGLKVEREFQQMIQQREQEAAQQLEQLKQQGKQQDYAQEEKIHTMDNRTKENVALIQADASLLDILNNTGLQEENFAEQQGQEAAKRIKERNESRKAEKENSDIALKKEDQNLKREQMANQLRIAKENKNQYDK